MAVDIDARTDTTTAEADWSTWSGAAIGTAAADRVIHHTVWYRAAGTVTGTDCTIGGVTATLIGRGKATSGNTTNVEVWSALVPTGTTADVTMTFSGTLARYARAVNPMYGSGGVTPEFVTTVDAGASGSLQHSANSGQLGAFTEQNNANNVSSWTNLTMDVSANIAGGPQAYSNAIQNAASGATETITANITAGSATNQGLVLASWAPASALPTAWWYGQFDQPKQRKVPVELMPTEFKALTPDTLPAPISGVAWWRPFDQPEQIRVPAQLQQTEFITLIPGTLPVAISGSAWNRGWEPPYFARRVHVHLMPTEFYDPGGFNQFAGISGISWWYPFDQPKQVKTDINTHKFIFQNLRVKPKGIDQAYIITIG